MRFIAPGEECLSATAIVTRFAEQTGYILDATNAGQVAKRLDLDYIEVDVDAGPGARWNGKERRYSILDLPRIFEQLQALADSRARHARAAG